MYIYNNILQHIDRNEIIEIHFNYMVFLTEKVYRQRELLLYKYDENSYYSSKSNSYFQLIYNSNNFTEEKKIIMIGFDTILKSKRLFILPKFNCSLRNKFTNIPYKKCTYADIFNYNLIDKAFRKKFRENVYIFRYYK